MSNCSRTTNNKFMDCPALSYSNFTDYRPSCEANDMIRQSNGIQSSYEYSQFLQKNAMNIIKTNEMYASEKYLCKPCVNYGPPSKTMCTYNRINSSCVETDCNGLGVYNKATSHQNINAYNPGLQSYVSVDNFPGSGNVDRASVPSMCKNCN